MSNSQEPSGLEQWDLTSQVSPYLDRHMVFPLLEFLDDLITKGVYSEYKMEEIGAARLALLQPTNLVDYAMDVYKGLNGDSIPKEMEEQKQQVLKDLEELKAGSEPLDKLCQNEKEKSLLQAGGQWNVSGLQEKYPDITADVVNTYLKLGRYEFDCGNYQTARDILRHYVSLFARAPVDTAELEDEELVAAGIAPSKKQQQQSNDKDLGNPNMYYLTKVDANMLQVLWGLLACEILVQDWKAASTAVDAVKTAMEINVSNNRLGPLEALQQRTWLMHWSLFVYWNVKGGLEQLVDLFHTERFRQAITTHAPHLLRYLTAAVLLCKRRVQKSTSTEARRLLRNLVHVMQDCEYSDPIVEFVNCLCVKFDFDMAQTKLAECEKVLAADFFLCQQTEVFMEEARVFVFENYCRIHNKIDLRTIGEKLAMDQDQAERWIVDLIRNADLDAKIQSEESCVIMGGNPQSIYEQVMEKTRDLNVRSATLTQNLTNLLNEVEKEKMKQQRARMDE